MTVTTIMVDELVDENNYEDFGWEMYYRRQKIGISENMYQCMIREIEQYQIIKIHLKNNLKRIVYNNII
jgi:hypothetical protein